MARRARERPQKSLADYLVIAVTPVLIMLLVGSLLFFLLEVFYHGSYAGRLRFIFAMFVMAIVLIGRISMEKGTEYAALYAIPVALVTGLAMSRFVQIQGALANIGWLVNLGLMGLVWWCAHKLTWDCTLIDERQDASGRGLLHTAGLDATDDDRSKDRGQQPDDDPPASPEGTTSRDSRQTRAPSWRERLAENRRRPHAPGVWVVYFSLAALPLFGLGQWWIAASDLASRQYGFKLLCVYVASGLGLLLTTSFLSLRRYLRQRRMDMPADMAGVWILTGCVTIVALLIFTALLPRPGAEYAISQFPAPFHSSDDLRTSRYGTGDDGPTGQQPGPHAGAREHSPEQQASQTAAESGQPGAAGDGSEDSQQAGSSSNGDGSSSEQGQQPQQGRAENGRSQPTGDDGSQQRRQPAEDSPPEQAEAGDSAEDSSASRNDSAGTTSSTRSFSPTNSLQNVGAAMATLLKLLFYLALIALVAYLLWKHWDQVRMAVSRLLQQWRALWRRWFGDKGWQEDESEPQQGSEQPVKRPFAEFRDPFAAGLAARYSSEQLVRYSFEALEAWADEHGWGRGSEQTPFEFAQQIGEHRHQLGPEASHLAQLYCQLAYSSGPLPSNTKDHLKRFWQQLAANGF